MYRSENETFYPELTQHIIAQDITLFAQTTSFRRSDYYLLLFKQNISNQNDQDAIKNILFDLYLNHELLLKKDAQKLLPSWIKCLNEYRQSYSTNCINRLLSTGLLATIDEVNYDQLNVEFLALLNLSARKWPQLANSVLAVFAKAKGQEALYDSCVSKHTLSVIFKEHSSNISVNDATLIIKPFISVYQKEKYFTYINSQLALAKNSINPINHYHAILALIKMLPTDHILWIDPFASVGILISQLKTFNDKTDCSIRPGDNFIMFRDKISDILAMIQSKLKDKEFLTKYKDVVSSFNDKALTEIVSEAINQQVTSEEWVVKQLEEHYYPHILTHFSGRIFFTRMNNYLNKLKNESHIKAAIEKLFVIIEGNYNDKIAISNTIAGLLLKINCDEFLSNYMGKLYKKTIHIHNDHSYLDKVVTNLSSVCKHPQLNDTTVSFHLAALCDFHDTNPCSILTSRMMFALCLNLKSEEAIEHWRGYFQPLILNCHEVEWFKNSHNLMYFGCYLIILSQTNLTDKPELANQMTSCITTIFRVFKELDDDRDGYKVINQLDKLLVEILSNSKSKEMLAPYLHELPLARRYLAFLVPLVLSLNNDVIEQSMNLIMDKLKHYLKSDYYLFDLNFIEDLSLLLVQLPHCHLLKIADMLFKTDTEKCLVPDSIKEGVDFFLHSKGMVIPQRLW